MEIKTRNHRLRIHQHLGVFKRRLRRGFRRSQENNLSSRTSLWKVCHVKSYLSEPSLSPLPRRAEEREAVSVDTTGLMPACQNEVIQIRCSRGERRWKKVKLVGNEIGDMAAPGVIIPRETGPKEAGDSGKSTKSKLVTPATTAGFSMSNLRWETFVYT